MAGAAVITGKVGFDKWTAPLINVWIWFPTFLSQLDLFAGFPAELPAKTGLLDPNYISADPASQASLIDKSGARLAGRRLRRAVSYIRDIEAGQGRAGCRYSDSRESG